MAAESFDKSQVLGFFIDESQEQVGTLNNLLLSLEENPGSSELINEIFRIAHTLKGASGMMGFKKVSELAHAMEDMLGIMRDRGVTATPRVMDVLFRALDGVAAILNVVSDSGREPEEDDIREHLELSGDLRDLADKMERHGQDFEEFEDDSSAEGGKSSADDGVAGATGEEASTGDGAPDKATETDTDADKKQAQEQGAEVQEEEEAAAPGQATLNGMSWSLTQLASDPTSKFGLSDIRDASRKFAQEVSVRAQEVSVGAQEGSSVFSDVADLASSLGSAVDVMLDEGLQPDPGALAALKFSVESFKDALKAGPEDHDGTMIQAAKRSLLNALDALRKKAAQAAEQEAAEQAVRAAEEQEDEAAHPVEKAPEKGRELAMKFFKEEADLHLQKISSCLTKLTKAPNDPIVVEQLKKVLGYLKGSALSMGFAIIGEVAEKMEIITTDCARRSRFSPTLIITLEDCLSEINRGIDGDDISMSSLRVLSRLWRVAESELGDIKVENVVSANPAGDAVLEVKKAQAARSAKSEPQPASPIKDGDDTVPLAGRPMIIHNIEELPTEAVTEKKRKTAVPASAEAKAGKKPESPGPKPARRARGNDNGKPPKKTATPPPAKKKTVAKSGVKPSADASIPEKTPARAKAQAGRSASAPTVQTVRVAIGKLDSLMNLVGELLFNKLRMDQKVVNFTGLQEWLSELRLRLAKIQSLIEELDEGEDRGSTIYQELMEGNLESLKDFLSEIRDVEEQFSHLDGEFSDLVQELSEGMRRMSMVTGDLQEGIMKTRMLPISSVFDKFPRLVRDLARHTGKEVRLDIGGGDTELDKTVLEKVSDPLIHLIRNTVDHGIETQEEREVLGKHREGYVSLNAEQRGDLVIIEIADDGRGIDAQKVGASAVEKGMLTADEVKRKQPWELRNLVFAPGFSTKEQVTEVSGRGVGCDVVKRNIEDLKGIIELESEINVGTTFRIKLPLTLAIIQGLVVRIWDEKYVIPLSSVVESLKMVPDMLIAMGGKEAVRIRDEVLPLLRVDKALMVPGGNDDEEDKFLVIVASAEKRLGFMVHELVGKQEIVIKTLGALLKRAPCVAGSTIMGDGRVLLILDVAALVQQGYAWVSDVTTAQEQFEVEEESSEDLGKLILVVDDSPTIRSIERNLLEAEGYRVVTAEDGAQGLEMAREVMPALVISDVEMPVMNGYEMVRAIRSDEMLRKLPVIMVTTRSSEEDRIRGLRAGADEYLGKPFEQQSLIKSIRKFIAMKGI